MFFSGRHIEIFFLFDPENMIWHFMQIASLRGYNFMQVVIVVSGKIRKQK